MGEPPISANNVNLAMEKCRTILCSTSLSYQFGSRALAANSPSDYNQRRFKPTLCPLRCLALRRSSEENGLPKLRLHVNVTIPEAYLPHFKLRYTRFMSEADRSRILSVQDLLTPTELSAHLTHPTNKHNFHSTAFFYHPSTDSTVLGIPCWPIQPSHTRFV